MNTTLKITANFEPAELAAAIDGQMSKADAITFYLRLIHEAGELFHGAGMNAEFREVLVWVAGEMLDWYLDVTAAGRYLAKMAEDNCEICDETPTIGYIYAEGEIKNLISDYFGIVPTPKEIQQIYDFKIETPDGHCPKCGAKLEQIKSVSYKDSPPEYLVGCTACNYEEWC